MAIDFDYSKEYLIWTYRYPSSTAQVQEEYLLYDETGVIGSVGGTLGLFIGFSFRDIIAYLIKKIRVYCINN